MSSRCGSDFRCLIPLAGILLLASCSGGGGDGGPVQPDPPVPETITDLEAIAGTNSSVTLAWTVPVAATKADWPVRYDLRYTTPGNEDTAWESWTTATAPDPDETCCPVRSHEVTGLQAASTYVFGLRATTDDENWSTVSNLVLATAADAVDATPPAAITDLSLVANDGYAVTVAWSVAGDDSVYGRASEYELRYHTAPLTAATWGAATACDAEVTAADGDDRRRMRVAVLENETDYWFGVRATDDADNVSGLSNVVEATTGAFNVIRVNVEGTGDAATIEAAIDAAEAGDLVVVGPGHYTWTDQGTGDERYGMIFIGQYKSGFSVVSEAGPAATILDAERQGGVLFIQGHNDITVEGFTITGGLCEGEEGVEGERYAGGGIVFHLTNTIIRNCIITGNEATQGGGIWYGGMGHPLIEDCVIENNTSPYGGGVLIVNSDERIVLRNCVIRDNVAPADGEYGGVGAGTMAANVIMTIENCLVAGNEAARRGGAMYAGGLNDNCVIDGCTLTGNRAPMAAGIRLYGPDNGHEGEPWFLPTVTNCIIAFNEEGAAFDALDGGGLAGIGCCDVFGNEGGNAFPDIVTDLGGNFGLDPAFADEIDYDLLPDSPCRPGFHPAGDECGWIGYDPGFKSR